MARRFAKSAADAERVAAVREQLAEGIDWLTIALDGDGGDGDGAGSAGGAGSGVADDRTRIEKMGLFLKTLAARYSVTRACDAAGISRDTAYRWRKEDARFAGLWEVALTRAIEAVEATMYERAVAGEFLPGIALLKAARPERYRDNAPILFVQPPVTSIRFMSEAEHQAAVEAEYRIVPAAIPERAGEGR